MSDINNQVLKGRISDGLWRQNVVLMSGLLISPVAAGAVNFENALAITLVFSIVTFFTVFVCRLISRKIVYTLRIILYALIAALFYIPAVLAIDKLAGPSMAASVGIYLPILVVNPVILNKSETRFYLMPVKDMMPELIGYVLGFDIVCLGVGTFRDIIVNGRIGWLRLNTGFSVPALETTFGGLIMVGVLAAAARCIFNNIRNRRKI
ncbi:MAG: NADH:ubiquinone oxidoreductase subunit RnfE [Eubacterium sp.]|jgi:electron transport complex protein RnfE|nr:NADH:ubiquinone oxidoreductase subunit RnfE [Eubacterium sp.]